MLSRWQAKQTSGLRTRVVLLEALRERIDRPVYGLVNGIPVLAGIWDLTTSLQAAASLVASSRVALFPLSHVPNEGHE